MAGCIYLKQATSMRCYCCVKYTELKNARAAARNIKRAQQKRQTGQN